ncbi:MAG: hypothetical protein IK144_12160 [Bacteroidaceae bacterium]|nr:hypothetical protein [Bacteroidaceae bacterium]
MKKNFIAQLLGVLLLAVTGLMISSCKGCKGDTPKNDGQEAYHDYDGVVEDFTAGTAQIQALHRQTMYNLAGGVKYEWRNSRVILNDVITMENIDELHVTDVNDVFCYWNERGSWVQYVNSNVKNGVQIPWPINDIWIEDSDLSNLQIQLSAEDALQRLKEWNGIIPPATFLTLRCPVGPKDCNAQWVIGNVNDVIFIDAVTGEINDSNPAFR